MSKPNKSPIRVNVVLSEAALNDIDAVVGRLRKLGLAITQVLPLTGMISGTCTAKLVPALVDVDGVMTVEEDIEVGPLD